MIENEKEERHRYVMKAKTYRVYIVTLLTVLWMGIIFFFSSQPAVESASLSGGLFQKIQEFVTDIPVMGPIFSGGFTEHLLRKAAHMTEFAILGVLLVLCMREYIPEQWKIFRLPLAFVAGILYACTDEFHQRFVPGRSGELKDVMIDSVGVFMGILLISVILACVKWKKEVY